MLRSFLLTFFLVVVAPILYSQEEGSAGSPGPLEPPTVIQSLQTPIQLPATPFLAKGTPVHLRLLNTIRMKDAKVGDAVPFEVTRNIRYQDVVVIPRGTQVLGGLTDVVLARRASRGSHVKIAIKNTHSLDAKEVQLSGAPTFQGTASPALGTAFDATMNVGGASPVTAVGATLALPVLIGIALAKKGTTLDVPEGQLVTAFVVDDLPLNLEALRVLPPNDDRSAPSRGRGHVHVLRSEIGVTANLFCNGIPIANIPRKQQLELDLPQGYYRFSSGRKKPTELFVAAGEDYYLFWTFSGFTAVLEPDDGEAGEKAATRMKPVAQKNYWNDPARCTPLPVETASTK